MQPISTGLRVSRQPSTLLTLYTKPYSSGRACHTPSRPMSQKPEILSREEYKTDAKWVKLENIKWKDQTGNERAWECANRTKRPAAGVDAVHILALLDHPSKPLSTVIIEQYRPPVNTTVIELPAGLVDEGEDVETAALRELHEETGYGNGKGGDGVAVEEISSVQAKDPGLVTVKVKLGADDPPPEQHLDEGEHIVTRIVPLRDLYDTLQDYAKKDGVMVDGLLGSLALGWKLAGKYA